jgi:hypothetical protein
MKSFEPIVTENKADPINLRAAGAPIIEIMSCLVLAKLSICASRLIRPPYAHHVQIYLLSSAMARWLKFLRYLRQLLILSKTTKVAVDHY